MPDTEPCAHCGHPIAVHGGRPAGDNDACTTCDCPRFVRTLILRTTPPPPPNGPRLWATPDQADAAGELVDAVRAFDELATREHVPPGESREPPKSARDRVLTAGFRLGRLLG